MLLNLASIYILFALTVDASPVNGSLEVSQPEMPFPLANNITSEDNTTDAYLQIYICKIDSFQASFMVANDLLEMIIGGMKSFINSTYFDVLAFESYTLNLDTSLTYIERLVHDVYPCKNDLTDKLAFANDMFEDMRKTAALLGYYDNSKSQHQVLVRKVVTLLVTLFTLYDSRGFPKVHEAGFAQTIGEYEKLLTSWNHEFQRIPNTPLGVAVVFRTKLRRAETTLRDLQKSLPG
ncbi:hypothetical protein JCM33374_g1874 [Metschnikowia sp. JCM 33374]|nr:hypothetical protein JCM33374_g1874 [Metschnikowia sp. JCM 33374]